MTITMTISISDHKKLKKRQNLHYTHTIVPGMTEPHPFKCFLYQLQAQVTKSKGKGWLTVLDTTTQSTAKTTESKWSIISLSQYSHFTYLNVTEMF